MESARFGPERIAVLPVVIVLLGSLPVALTAPALSWVVLLPLVALVWVLRAGVVADRDGLAVCNGLGRRRYRWSEVTGIDVPERGPVRLLLTGGARVPMTTVSRREVRRLIDVGGGA